MASENSFAMTLASVYAGSEEGLADVGMVADDHRDGHRLAERAAKAEHDGADDADARVAQDADADHLPARGAEREHGFALAVGHGLHDVAGERRDDGQDHDGENDAGGEQADAEVRARRRDRSSRESSPGTGRADSRMSGTRTKTAHRP